ncbi:polyprenol monophosphomannose synthase [Patescibacteria group bacterium]|nr:polyprenol monophosphomannose synthase [Patescibacteria group bacterium]MBU0964574.1 polyprenol monophosphomannose synthase [Patescibacteria group bacterium]
MYPVVILPTYNEEENIAGIVREIFLVGIDDLRIIIVDDNSPDGTGKIADNLAAKYSQLQVIHREKKEGLGRAYKAGFKQALTDKEAGFIFEMDADFSHQPKYLKDFLKAIKSADIVLGSRYMPGGGVENWNLTRRFISWLANFTIRILLGVPIRDLTGGYKCFNRRVLENMDFTGAESRGYNFQIEITYKAYKKGYKITEIPIIFVERRAGLSKFNFMIMFESFWKVLKLRVSNKDK